MDAVDDRIGITDRLRREGRWDEANRFREERRKALRREGKSREEARQASWLAMGERFPAQEGSTLFAVGDNATLVGDTVPVSPVPPPLSPAECPRTADLYGDAIWVYHNLATIPHGVPPSPGANGLLQWARKNPGRFFEQLLPKVIIAAPSKESKNPTGYMQDEGLAEIERMLAELGEAPNPTAKSATHRG